MEHWCFKPEKYEYKYKNVKRLAFKDEEISGIGVLIFWVEISPIQMGWQGLFQYETMTLSKCWWDAPNSAGFCND